MQMRTLPLAALFVLLAACSTGGDPVATPTPRASVPATDGVVLTLDGAPGAECHFVLNAHYPENLALHTLPIEFMLRAADGSVAHESGFYVELPMVGVDWTERTDTGLRTALVDGRAEAPCDSLRGSVALGDCHQGACPRYGVAAHSDIALELR